MGYFFKNMNVFGCVLEMKTQMISSIEYCTWARIINMHKCVIAKTWLYLILILLLSFKQYVCSQFACGCVLLYVSLHLITPPPYP